MNAKTSIVILTYNNLDYTRRCLESVFTKTAGMDFEVIIVDNASQDETPQFLRQFAAEHTNIKLIFNENNEGFARGNNIGAAASNSKYLIFLNNDTIVTNGWVAGLVRHLQDPQVGMVGPVTNSSGNETGIKIDYTSLDQIDSFAERYTRQHAGETIEISMLPFQCVALRREVFDEIGPLDEMFGTGMFEDDDYAMRLKEKGFKILCIEDVFIHHFGSASFSKLGDKIYWQLFKENLHKFETKWATQWYPHMQRPELIPEQLRQLFDSKAYYTDVIADREQYITQLQNHIADLEAIRIDQEKQIGEKTQTISWLSGQLNGIYQSNGWALLQRIMHIRRFLIPENSRREAIFRILFQTLRDFQLRRLVNIFSEIRKPAKKRETESSTLSMGILPVEPQMVLFPAQAAPIIPQALANRFPQPLVSVILPVYNHADMLEGAAKSILHGAYHNIELIILDDGSTDKIDPVLQSLAIHPRVRILRQPNQKLPRALTHAHQWASGQFITWTSADNLMAPNALEVMIQALLAHPEAVLVYADVGLIDEKGQKFYDRDYRPQNQDAYQHNVIRLYQDSRPLGYEADNYINACFLYRSEAAQSLEGRFADDLRGAEDYDFWLRMQRCGLFYHVRNRDPLYYYRVHRRTMSHEILSQNQERTAHFNRIQNLMEYEKQRRIYAQQRWHISIDESLPYAEKVALQEAASRVAADLDLPGKGNTSNSKRLVFTIQSSDDEKIPADSLTVNVKEDAWQFNWHSSLDSKLHAVEVEKGVEIPPLALKARQYQPNRWEIPQAGQKPVLGCHAGLGELPVDIDATRQVIKNNPSFFFLFVDIPAQADPQLGQQLVQNLENAAYLGPRDWGTSYPTYACFDIVWLPPLSGSIKQRSYHQILALAYTIGRPLLAPKEMAFIPAPYQFYYHSPDESLEFMWAFDRTHMDVKLINDYLQIWSPASRLEYLTRLAEAATQEMFIPRPDFEMVVPPVVSPVIWHPGTGAKDGIIKCGLILNTMDKGGLEELVAQLAQGLPKLGIETFILCTQDGGTIAETVKAQGIPVYIAHGQPKQFQKILEKENPHLVNTHLADIDFLQVAEAQGIPIVETIHSSYIWLDQDTWADERKRSKYFTHAIATSETTRRFYLKWNTALLPDWITVVPNGIDVKRLEITDRTSARQKLGVDNQTFLFVMIASYDGVKNHFGVLTAFDVVARKYPQARLLFAGNIANNSYYQQLNDYSKSLAAHDRIELHEYRQDVGNILSAADVFINNSFSEGWSLAATEALLAGVPLIHSHCGSAQELIGPTGERGILVPNPITAPINLTRDTIFQTMYQQHQNNTEALINAMAEMIEKRSWWAAKRSQIQVEARSAFAIENMLQGYAGTFRQYCIQPNKLS